MAGVPVPQLLRKLGMLVQGGHFGHMNDVAAALNRSPVTVRGWGSGGGGGPPDTVPSSVLPQLIELFARALPGLPVEEVRRLLSGPAEDLQSALGAATIPSLRDLIAREADRTQGTLYTRDDGPFGLIVRKGSWSAVAFQESVEIGQDFRIAFKTSSRAVYTVALQHAPGGWGFVACTLDRDAGIIHLPGPEEGGETGWIAEDNEVGAHLFVAAQASRPFPHELYSAGRDGIRLDRTLLLHFVRNYLGQDEKARRLFAMYVRIS